MPGHICEDASYLYKSTRKGSQRPARSAPADAGVGRLLRKRRAGRNHKRCPDQGLAAACPARAPGCGAGGGSRGGDMGGRGGGLEPGGGSRGASFGGLGMRAMFSLILVCKTPLEGARKRASVGAPLYGIKRAAPDRLPAPSLSSPTVCNQPPDGSTAVWASNA